MRSTPILVVDDIADVRNTISGILQDEGYEVCPASSRAKALQLLDARLFSVAIIDVRLDEADEGNLDGLHLMREINYLSPETAIIILTGYGTKEMVREALRPDKDGFSSAYDFLDKSEDVYVELPHYIQKAIEHHSKAQRYQPKNEIEQILFDSLRTRFSEIGKYNILVEGLTDKQYLELAVERYQRIKGIDLLDNGQVRLIASRGTKHLAPLFGTLQPLQENGLRFVVILDGDEVGRRVAESMRQFNLQKNRHFFQLECKGYQGNDGRTWDVEIEDLLPWHLLETFINQFPEAIEERFQRGHLQKVVVKSRVVQEDGNIVNYKLHLAEYVRQNAVLDDLAAFINVLNKARKCMKLPQL
jgi:CheY-like chemotaxis protein